MLTSVVKAGKIFGYESLITLISAGMERAINMLHYLS